MNQHRRDEVALRLKESVNEARRRLVGLICRRRLAGPAVLVMVTPGTPKTEHCGSATKFYLTDSRLSGLIRD
jgi:hypothetical protein